MLFSCSFRFVPRYCFFHKAFHCMVYIHTCMRVEHGQVFPVFRCHSILVVRNDFFKYHSFLIGKASCSQNKP